MASHSTSVAVPQGGYDDWTELKNIAGETVDLSGVYLSDNLQNYLNNYLWSLKRNYLTF
jgi:hypothetical protein